MEQSGEQDINVITETSATPCAVKGTINQWDLEVLLDTGASVTLVAERILKSIRSKQILKPWTGGKIKAANGQAIPVEGVAHLGVVIGDVMIYFNAIVSNAVTRDLILGRDVLKKAGAVLNMANDTVKFQNSREIHFSVTPRDIFTVDYETVFHVYIQHETIVPPKSEMIVDIDIPDQGVNEFEAKYGLISKLHLDETTDTVMVGNCLVKTAHETCCMVANVTDKTMVLKQGQVIGQFQALRDDEIPEPKKTRGETTRQSTPKYRNNIPPDIDLSKSNLSEAQLEVAKALLFSYRDIFAEDLADVGVGQLRGFEFSIELKPGVRPIYIRNYRKSEEQHKAIDTFMKERLEKGVSEPSNSAWNANTLAIPKKTGGMRICLDMRSLNNITDTVVFPIPRQDEMFDAIAGMKWFSLADATCGYWQIPMKKEHRTYAAFSTREGHFQPTTMDFGFKNAPAFWQRAMHSIFGGLLWQRCVIYIDDLLIFSDTFEGHIENMRRCFERCREWNLHLRPSKCHFFQTKIDFLGHVISGEGIEMDPRKISKIINVPIPANREELNSWVHLVQYYRAHISHFSDVVAPLRTLVLAEDFQWTNEHTTAFELTKKMINERVVLEHPIRGKEFWIYCDASNTGISYILSQFDDDNRERVIYFGSRALTKTERNYSTTERECLAMVEGVRQYHVYIHGQKIHICTDHKALEWLSTHKDQNSKLMRWAMKLQGYDYVVHHREGKKHGNADALSRLRREPTVNAITTNAIDIRRAQKADPTIRDLLNYIRNRDLPDEPDTARKIVGMSNQLTVEDGILYHIWWPETKRNRQETRRQLFIPGSLKLTVLMECHDSNLTGGHLGFNKTHQKIRERYWWPFLYSETKNYVLGCNICQQRKGARPKNNGLLLPITASEPFEVVGMDVFGPLPETDDKYRWVLSFTCYFTKWVTLWPLQRMDEQATAEGLVEGVICTHGVMKSLYSDRGGNFVGRMMQEVYKLLTLRKVTTTAYNPQANGLTEVFNKSMASMLASYTHDNNRGWKPLLPYIAFAYNTSVQESTLFSPFFLLYGREPRFPLELATGTADYVGGKFSDIAEDVTSRFQNAYELARTNQDLAHFKKVNQGDQRRRSVNFEVGSKVWLYIPQRTDRNQGTHRKLKFPWQGPFIVVCRPGTNTLELRREGGNKIHQLVHVNRVKTFREQKPLNPPTLDERDEFNYTTERGIVSDFLGDGELTDEGEQLVDKIKGYRIKKTGILEFQVQWGDGDLTWEVEDTVSDCAALDKFFAESKNPWLALELEIRKLRAIFAASRYNYKHAVDTLIETIDKHVCGGKETEKLANKINDLTGINAVRTFVDEFLEDFTTITKQWRNMNNTHKRKASE